MGVFHVFEFHSLSIMTMWLYLVQKSSQSCPPSQTVEVKAQLQMENNPPGAFDVNYSFCRISQGIYRNT